VLLYYSWNVVGPYWTVERRAEALASANLPPALAGLQKVDFQSTERNNGSPEGAHSRTYKYKSDDGTVFTVSFDFPFIEFWHELTECYRGTGWDLVSRHSSLGTSSKSGDAVEYIECDLSKSNGD